jgi:hypothetical protein
VPSVEPGHRRSARSGALRGAAVAVVVAAALAASVFVAAQRFARVHVRVVAGPLPAAADGDSGQTCADVGTGRACWGELAAGRDCKGGACVVPRPTPEGAAPALGWRCEGRGKSRVCVDRRYNSSTFSCDAVGSCVQPEPRMPDDAEWECVDIDGVAYCHATAEASAVVAGPADLGWTCGPRRGSRERVCVDLSPDRPDARGYKCTFQYSRFYPTRVCVRSDVPTVGSACGQAAAGGSKEACPADATCTGGICVPPRPDPGCWIDADCVDGARCRWGTCTGSGA